MTILVTGGAGFIGSHLIERLLTDRRAALQVICLDDFNDYYDPALKRANVARFENDSRVTVVEKSFCDAAAMRRLLTDHAVRRVVHLGGYAGIRTSIVQPLVYEENNVRGTLALLEAARACPIERFVLVSSSTVYGPGAAVPFREDAPLDIPLSPYGATKRAAELLGLTYHRLHHVPVVCLRPFSVYGPRIRPDLAMHIFAESIVSRRPVPLFGDGSYRRDFTHVSDICDGLIAAMTAEDVAGEAINLGHHEPIEIRRLLELLEEELGVEAIVERRPAVACDLPVTCADLSKAVRLLGYCPKIAIAEGVREFVAWFRQVRTG